MKILATGADGLFGSWLKQKATEENLVFAGRSDADLRVQSEVEELFEKVQPDAVIHAAAKVGGIGGNLMKSSDYFSDNVRINLNVLEACHRNGVLNVVTFMSTCVFPQNATFPLTVDQLHSGFPHPSNFGYAFAKRMLDIQVRAYNEQWGTDFKILIPGNMYGPGDNFNLLEGHVLPALIHRAFLAREEGRQLEVWGSGRPTREFIFVRDVVEAALAFVKMENPGHPVIASNPLETSIQELVEKIVTRLDFSGDVVWNREMPDGQMKKPSSNAAFNKLFPGFKFTSIDEGLDLTVSWFEDNYPNIRA